MASTIESRHFPALRPQFDLIDLRLFANVAARGNLTRGAHDTALSLAAASLRIRGMEQVIGSDLFIRTRQGVELTSAGKVFQRGAEEILRHLQLLHDGLQDVLNSTAGHVRIVANILAASDLLPALIADYLHAHPEVTIAMDEALSAHIVRMVRQGQADIGVAVGEIEPADELEILPCRSLRWAIITPAEHPLAGNGPIGLTDALHHEFVGRSAKSSIFTVLESLARRHGRPLRMRARLGTFDGICQLVEAAIGISVVPEETALRHARTYRIAVVPVADDWACRQMRVCIRRDWAIPPFARDLLDMLLDPSGSVAP